MKLDIDQALGLATQLCVLIAAVGAGVVWLRKWIRRTVAEPVERIQTQVQPDGGRSLHDKMTRVETKVDVLSRRLDKHLIEHYRSNRPDS